MAEAICRALRDGGLAGEHASALTIMDSIASPCGPHVFSYFLTQLFSNISSGKSQSQGLVLVSLSRSPSHYIDLLKSKENDADSLKKWIRVLDCYSDPLGWKDQLGEQGIIINRASEASETVRLYKNLKNLDFLLSSILELGQELVGKAKGHFLVAIDSVSDMLRHTSISSVAALLSDVRSNDQVTSAFWLLHSDHGIRVTAAFEYLSSMLACVEPTTPSSTEKRGNSENFSPLEQNSWSGKFRVRLKRRNGRVRLLCEDFCIEQSEIRFLPASSDGGTITQNLVPKVQFNLQLSEKEKVERAKVVLPFEHQGTGEPIEIYDGRRSVNGNDVDLTIKCETMKENSEPGKGEIIYYRDSDDEMPDSDEDPDDDLDI